MVNRGTHHMSDLIFTYDMFVTSVNKLVRLIKSSNKKYDAIYAIPRGGLILGVFLSHRLELPLLNKLDKTFKNFKSNMQKQLNLFFKSGSPIQKLQPPAA